MLLHALRNCCAHLLARLSFASMTSDLAAARIRSSRFFSEALSASPPASSIFPQAFRTNGCCPFSATVSRPPLSLGSKNHMSSAFFTHSRYSSPPIRPRPPRRSWLLLLRAVAPAWGGG